MNVEAEATNRVAVLLGRKVSLEDLHRLILDINSLLSPTVPIVMGPDFAIRWVLGVRSVELGVTADSKWGYKLTLRCYDTQIVESEEKLAVDYREPDEDIANFSYAWSIYPLGAPKGWLDLAYMLCYNWSTFDMYFAPVLNSLPEAIKLMPPTWRKPVNFSWNMEASGWGTVQISATEQGLTISSAVGAEQVEIPLEALWQVDITAVLSGLGGGVPLKQLPFLGCEGLANGPESLTGQESAEDLELFAEWEDDEENEIEPDGSNFPALSFDDVRNLVAKAQLDESEGFEEKSLQGVPVNPGLALQSVFKIIDSWLSGITPSQSAIEAGACPGDLGGRQAWLGPGWYLEKRYAWNLNVAPEPKEASLELEPASRARMAWSLAWELEKRYGAPIGSRTTSQGGLSRLFKLGDKGVQVHTDIWGITVTLGDFIQIGIQNSFT